MLTRTLALGCTVLLGIAGSTQGQVPQPNIPPAGAKLELSSASDAAKAEFWLGLEDWQNFTFSSAQKHFERATSLDRALVWRVRSPRLWVNGLVVTAEFDRGLADAARLYRRGAYSRWRGVRGIRSDAAIPLSSRRGDRCPMGREIQRYVWAWRRRTRKPRSKLESGRTKFPTSGRSPSQSACLSGDARRRSRRSGMQVRPRSLQFRTYGDFHGSRPPRSGGQYRRSLTFARSTPTAVMMAPSGSRPRCSEEGSCCATNSWRRHAALDDRGGQPYVYGCSRRRIALRLGRSRRDQHIPNIGAL